jgi:hypothetical protein
VLALPGDEPVPTAVHHLRSCGDAVITVGTGTPAAAAAAAGSPAVLELADHTPLRLREPVRTLVWLRGRVRTVPAELQRILAAEVAAEYPHPDLLDVGHGSALLSIAVESAVVADAHGAASVDAADLRAARPDPFWEVESAWLRHLDSDHAGLICQLARHLPVRLRSGAMHPLAIDRYGVTLRVEGPEADHDIRIPFDAPVDDARALSRAIRILVGCPLRYGLGRG